MGRNVSRPIGTRDLAEWVAAEIDAAVWSQGLGDNTAVELAACDRSPHVGGCGIACRFCGELDTIMHRCDGRLVVGTEDLTAAGADLVPAGSRRYDETGR
jgi:hypothetical protein